MLAVLTDGCKLIPCASK